MLSTSLFFAAVLVFIIANIQYSGLVVTIRQHYQEYYESIGSPPALFVTPLNAGAAWSFLIYVTLAEYKNDKPPEQIVSSLQATRATFLVAFLLLALAIGTSLL